MATAVVSPRKLLSRAKWEEYEKIVRQVEEEDLQELPTSSLRYRRTYQNEEWSNPLPTLLFEHPSLRRRYHYCYYSSP